MEGCPSNLFPSGDVTLSKGLIVLKSEHEPLRDRLQQLFSLCENVDAADEKETVFLQLIEKVKEFIEKLDYHSTREEDFLFRMMEKYVGKNGGPIAVMEYEHEQAHKHIQLFLEKAKSGQSDRDMLSQSNLIKTAYNILLSHFAKEENVLYPMAENIFTDEEKEQLYEKVTSGDYKL